MISKILTTSLGDFLKLVETPVRLEGVHLAGEYKLEFKIKDDYLNDFWAKAPKGTIAIVDYKENIETPLNSGYFFVSCHGTAVIEDKFPKPSIDIKIRKIEPEAPNKVDVKIRKLD